MVQLFRLQPVCMVNWVFTWSLVHPCRQRRHDCIPHDPIAHRSIHPFPTLLFHLYDCIDIHGHISIVLPLCRCWSWMVVRLHHYFYDTIFHCTNLLLEKISRYSHSPHKYRDGLCHATGLPEFHCNVSTWSIEWSND